MKKSMESEELNKAHNPLLPSAVVAIQRAALRARQIARQTQTAIVVARGDRIERITQNEVQEPPQDYSIGDEKSGDEDGV